MEIVVALGMIVTFPFFVPEVSMKYALSSVKAIDFDTGTKRTMSGRDPGGADPLRPVRSALRLDLDGVLDGALRILRAGAEIGRASCRERV